jgi:hypothetical protein
MTLTHILAAACAAASLASFLPAQIQVFGGNQDQRANSMLVYFSDKPEGGIAITYGQPEWKAEYDAMAEKAKGQRFRLGKNWWSTFDTSARLEFGKTTIPAGSYFVGLECDKEGNFQLLLLNAHRAMVQNEMPFTPKTWKVDHTIPMTFEKGALTESVKKLTIDLKAPKDDPTQVSLTITWGTHRLTANAKAHLGGAADAAHGRDMDKEHDRDAGEHGKKGDKGK